MMWYGMTRVVTMRTQHRPGMAGVVAGLDIWMDNVVGGCDTVWQRCWLWVYGVLLYMVCYGTTHVVTLRTRHRPEYGRGGCWTGYLDG